MVYRFQQELGVRLLGWSALSVISGLLLLATVHGFLEGFGLQAAIWGAIDGVIAIIGIRDAQRQAAMPHGAKETEANRKRLFGILKINAIIDPFYITAGIIVAAIWGRNPYVLGIGWGIIVQGMFLFAFDFVHTLIVQVMIPFDPDQTARSRDQASDRTSTAPRTDGRA
ncbi:MAG TPA: hypothetical protein VMW73_06995 [Spirochaetia bacterium]|nr:hypothetical protein [Spirochaetia bacterium]